MSDTSNVGSDWTGDHTSTTFVILSRAGFAARGVTYFVIGALALMAAFSGGGGTMGSSGALGWLEDSGGGVFLLYFVGLGLFGYALWRVVSALLDLENYGTDAKGIGKRAAHFVGGLFHAGLGGLAFALAWGDRESAGGGSTLETLSQAVMSQPYGKWLVVAAGAGALVAAAAQVKKALNEEFRSHTRVPEGNGFVLPAIKAGLIARGVVFAIIGGFLIKGGLAANPDQVRGTSGALEWLQSQSYGSYLLGLIALGLICFAFFSFVQARYRYIPDPQG